MKTIDQILILAACVLFLSLVVISGYEEPTIEKTFPSIADVLQEPEAENTSQDETIVDVYVAPPTPVENLKSFLAIDQTDEHEYNISNDYVCIDFSIDLATNLTSAGYDAGVVLKSAKWHGMGGGHMLNWVVIENETLYIEPQRDYVFTPNEFVDEVDNEDYVVREITTENAERLRDERRRWG